MSLLPEISQASAEINKLVAQANIHQTIAPVDPAAFTDPADTMLLASRDPVIREVSVGMTGVEAVQYTVSGTPPLSLPNSLGKPLKAWEVDLLPYQEGTGDPAPDNVRAIHGTDKIGVYVGSPNIWDEEWEVGTISGADGQNESADNRIRSKNYIPVKRNAQYRIVGTMDLFYYDVNKAYIGNVTGASNITFTTSENSAFIRFRLPTSYGTTYNHDIAINYPSTVATYNPHQGGITSITLPQTVYTGTIGSEGGESRWNEYVFDGSADENWVLQSINEHGIANFYYTITPYKPSVTPNGICNMFTQQTSSIASTTTEGWMLAAGTYLYIRISADKANTSSQFKTWLASNNLQFVYELATPTTFAVPSVSIPTPTGTATTWATAEEGTVESMEVTYVGKA